MYADYEEFAAAHRQQCYERRKAEEEAQYEREKSAADVRKTGAGIGLVYKDRDNARVADDNAGASVERRASAKPASEQSWWQWTDKRIEQHLKSYSEELTPVIGEAMAEWVGRKVDPIKRELELTRR